MNEQIMKKTLENMRRLYSGDTYSNFDEYYAEMLKSGHSDEEAAELAYAMCEQESKHEI